MTYPSKKTTASMCELLAFVLPLISLAAVVLFWLGAKNERSCMKKDTERLIAQIENCQEERLKKSIEEKASAWRRDRRYGDNKHGGYFVSHEDDPGSQ